MIEIINISNYDNNIKKLKLNFWQWYKSRERQRIIIKMSSIHMS